ncbi:unnamed protein product, partial [marine sediment metagenome]
DYDNDGDLDLALSGDTGSGYISKIYKSFEAEFSNSNSVPSSPNQGFSSVYSSSTDRFEFKWDYGSDIETPQKGLYYNIRIATEPISDNIDKWIISPSTGASVGYASCQNLGNYPHGFISTSTQPGLRFNSPVENNTYYWQVRSVDTGLLFSEWSDQQSVYFNSIPPGQITGFLATTDAKVHLSWVAPGDDNYEGNVTNGIWQIKSPSLS